MRFPILALVSLCLILSSCGPAIRNVPPAHAADPKVYSASLPETEYVIQPGDLLDIKFFYSPELNEQVPVRPDGRISLQLAHEIMAAGLTPAKLAKTLGERYSKELKKPEITVIVRGFGSQRIFVDGEVARPGMVPLAGPTTVLQAISMSGGFKDTGRLSQVVVLRRGPGSRPSAMVVNTEKALEGIDTTQDIFLRPFDIVYVPRTIIADVDLWVDQYLNKVIPRIGFFFTTPVGKSTMGYDTSGR